MDIERCASLRLGPDVAFARALALENAGRGAEALQLHEAVLRGVFSGAFSAEYLKSRAPDVVGAVIREEAQTRSAQGAAVQPPQLRHRGALLHAALLLR